MSVVPKPFVGNFDRRLDDKLRVVIPARWAERVKAESDGVLYLVPSGTRPCVEAYPAARFVEIAQGQRPDPFGGTQDDRRAFFHLAVEAEIKGPGRVSVPKDWADHYFPGGAVKVAGMLDYLELWDPDVWQEEVGKSARLPFAPRRPSAGKDA